MKYWLRWNANAIQLHVDKTTLHASNNEMHTPLSVNAEEFQIDTPVDYEQRQAFVGTKLLMR